MADKIGIYSFKNITNGKEYIGQTCAGLNKRKKQHIKSAYNQKRLALYNTPFYRAIRKYGINDFIFEQICSCNINELDELECKYIKERNTLHPNGYNLTTGGNGKKIISAFSKQRMLESLKERYRKNAMGQETKALISNSLKLHYLNNDTSIKTRCIKSRSHQKISKGMPRYVNIRKFPKKTVYCIGKHPKLKYKQFDTLDKCLMYLFLLDNIDTIKKIDLMICNIIKQQKILQMSINKVESALIDFQKSIESMINSNTNAVQRLNGNRGDDK